MRKILPLLILALLFIGCENKRGTFINSIESRYPTAEGVKKFEKILEEEGLSIFQVIDHAQNAKNSEMELLPNTLVVFGDAKVGSVLMQCNASIGLDLPLKMLFTTDYDGKHWISYTNPEYYTLQHNIKDQKCLEVIGKVNMALQSLSGKLAKNDPANPQTKEQK